jgi:uncharacterized membrane protein
MRITVSDTPPVDFWCRFFTALVTLCVCDCVWYLFNVWLNDRSEGGIYYSHIPNSSSTTWSKELTKTWITSAYGAVAGILTGFVVTENLYLAVQVGALFGFLVSSTSNFTARLLVTGWENRTMVGDTIYGIAAWSVMFSVVHTIHQT